MVNIVEESRNHCSYCLDTLHQLADQKSVIYGGRRVEIDIENLGYSPEDVHGILRCFRPEDFVQSERYQESRVWMDVYRFRYISPKNDIDDLFVKVKIATTGRVVVVVGSFHRDR